MDKEPAGNSRFFTFLGRVPVVISLFFTMLILSILLNNVLFPSERIALRDKPLPDFDMIQKPGETLQSIRDFGPDGRKVYTKLMVVDMFFPIAYGLFFAGLLSYLLMGLKLSNRLIPWLGLIPGILDISENICFYTLVLSYETGSKTVEYFAAFLTPAKYIIMLNAMIVGTVLAVRNITKRLYARLRR